MTNNERKLYGSRKISQKVRYGKEVMGESYGGVVEILLGPPRE